jgi:glycosyltransferase involved in cell wall biosynthesis
MTTKAVKKILIISHDKIGSNMAGPGIRYHHMAEVLSKSFDVTVGFFDPTYLPDATFTRSYSVLHVDNKKFHQGFKNTNAVIAMWLSEEMMIYCKDNNIFITFDVYAPVPVEGLALFMLGSEKVTANTDYYYRQSYNLYEKFFQYGDLFLFSNKRQLDFWVGYVFGSGIISVSNYLKRDLFRRFVIAPMGIDTTQELTHTENVMRGKIKGINENDQILLWTGGIWNWFDAQTLIKSMENISKERPDIKLVFFGTKHPNPDVPAMQEASAALSLARELKLLNKNVFIHEGWVPYEERINYLLEANVAINTTKDTIESEFAHRTRVLDHILANLPTVATSGDYLSDEVITNKNIGIVVPPGNVGELSKAIIDSVEPNKNKQIRKNITKVRHEYDWNETLAPLYQALLEDTEKLPFVVVKKPREMPKNALSYKTAKKFLPRPVKTFIVKVLRYGR